MDVINVEIKARCHDHERIRRLLKAKNARFVGLDHQVDTYFQTDTGRLKLRQGTIENNLIWYQRPDRAGPKTSHCRLYKTEKGSALKNILQETMGVMVIVDKEREIHFIDNIKIHLDRVEGLGTFLEIEAQSEVGDKTEDFLNSQCSGLMQELGISPGDLLSDSYSDLLIKLQDEDH